MATNFDLVQGELGLKAILRLPWSDRIEKELQQIGVREIELNQAKGWSGVSLDFLERFPELHGLEVLDLRIKDVYGIHHLHELKRLTIFTYCKTRIDFSVFACLESLSLEWRSGCKDLFSRRSLLSLFLNRYRARDTQDFARLTSLSRLGLLNSSVKSLQGLSALSSLTRLRLGLLRGVELLSGLEELVGLEELTIETCRKIRVIDELASCINLKMLALNNCGDIESLRPIRRLAQLERLFFVESTNILDGDLTPLLDLEHLRDVSYQNRRHYSHQREFFKDRFKQVRSG
ncbi:MAG: hypothetical protein RLN76_01265 [Phycisphaeraceae bacterium]